MRHIVVIAHNIRSIHNVGSLFRTCEGLGIERLILSGYTPHPRIPDDVRLPHSIDRLMRQLHKTALGAETIVSFEYAESPPLSSLREQGFTVVGLEQDRRSVPLHTFHPPQKIALLLGEEVAGIKRTLLDQCDTIIEIPMFGKKESFNVSVAAGIALYTLMTTS